MDDLSTSVQTSAAGIDLYDKCKSRFKKASFDVRKWRSNDPELRRKIAQNEVTFE